MQQGKFVRYILGLLLMLIIVAGTLSAYLLYMPFYFPKPTGPYTVGMQQYSWVDTKRKEPRSTDPAHPYRELMVKAWYPAGLAEAGLKTVAYAPALPDAARMRDKAIIEKIKFLICGGYRPKYVYEQYEAPVRDNNRPFPVIIFSHGYGIRVDGYTAYCEELASHGYIVFGINHTFDCEFVDLPDGRHILMSPDLEKKSGAEVDLFFEKEIDTWIADARFVLDQIEREANIQTSKLYKKLDLERVGIMGHSYGGATAAQCCRLDKRFTAGCDMDGALFGVDFAKAFSKPFMFIRGANACEDSAPPLDSKLKPEERERAKICHKQHVERYLLGIKKLAMSIGRDAYLIDLPETQHMTFTDMAILKHAGPFPWFYNYFGTGSVNGYRITGTVTHYLVAFFDKYLKKSPVDILEQYRMDKVN